MGTKVKLKIWPVILVFLLPMGCRTPDANEHPVAPNPISNNEYEFGMLRCLTRPALSKKEFCSLVHNPVHFKRVILNRNNRLAFDDSGGIRNGGLCWWHSRLTRSATYLTVYKPDLPKPTEEQVLEIFDAWVHNSRVVEIPGYKNLREFSRAWRHLLRKKLERWQIMDGIVRFGWIRGLIGKTKVAPEELKEKMDKLFEQVRSENKIVYQKLQVPGIKVHSWLVVDMKKTSDGYILRIADSDYPGLFDGLLSILSSSSSSSHPVKDVRYRIGDRHIRYRSHTCVPYTERQDELKEIRAAQLRYCRSN